MNAEVRGRVPFQPCVARELREFRSEVVAHYAAVCIQKCTSSFSPTFALQKERERGRAALLTKHSRRISFHVGVRIEAERPAKCKLGVFSLRPSAEDNLYTL
jgi:hypothetical protein